MFIKLDNGEPVGSPLLEENVRYLFSNIEWPVDLTPEFANSIGYGLYKLSQQPTIEKYQKIEEDRPQLGSDGIWYQIWRLVPQSDKEIQEVTDRQAEVMRQERNHRLFMTDWTQIPNSELTAGQVESYANYRSLLRRVTQQPGFPWNIEWPEIPE